MRLHLLWFLLVVQLATVVTAVTRAPVERLPAWLGQALEVFGEYTGAGNRYSFYAPRPSLPLRVVARLYAPERGEWISETLDWKRGEPALRLATITDRLQDAELSKEQAASWAAWFFGRHQETTVAIIEIQFWNIPSLKMRETMPPPAWMSQKVYTFARRDVPLFGPPASEDKP